ncbi:MAG: hypothetical protein HY270_00785 [Deltaproteobacteria bacterium]|nr:hypothetical protein [Deltaproteobacteria bacterium]
MTEPPSDCLNAESTAGANNTLRFRSPADVARQQTMLSLAGAAVIGVLFAPSSFRRLSTLSLVAGFSD